MKTLQDIRLFITDIDNTLFDWVKYYVHAIDAMLEYVSQSIGTPVDQLREETRDVFIKYRSIEYPFVIQELPSVMAFYRTDLDRMLHDLVGPAREVFKKEAIQYLQPYPGVKETLTTIKKEHPDVQLVALTDAPRYVAMWKLNKLGLLHDFDAVYGLGDPVLPTDPQLGRVKVDPEILLKHLRQSNFNYQGKIRILPDEYEKPGTKGLKMVLIDYDLDEDPEGRSRCVWVGDNLRKDIKLGLSLGVFSVWAEYGAHVQPEDLERLSRISPPQNIRKNAAIDPAGEDAPEPSLTLKQFSDVLQLFSP